MKNSKKWNINILLCEECDERMENIKNIFNSLYTKKDGNVHFDIVTIMNAINPDEERFGLYYFIEKVSKENSMISYVGGLVCDRIGGRDGYDSTCGMERMSVDLDSFPGLGQYEIKVFKHDGNDAKEISGDEKEIKHYYNPDKLISTYPFEIKKIDD